jgi:hypothetical protein
LGILGPIQNPLGIEGFSNIYYKAVLFTMVSLLPLAAFLAVFIRLRRAVGVERQQIKWFAYAAVATVSAATLAYPIPMVVDTPLWFERMGFALNIAFIPGIPIAIGIAILRYRLYDIDLLINRTLVYGSLTLMLALVYFGGVTATRLHPGDSRAVHPLEASHPVLHRQALLQKEVRCQKDLRRLLCPVAKRNRPERLERRPGGGGKGDYATRTRLAVVASRYAPEGRAGSLVAPYSPNCLE